MAKTRTPSSTSLESVLTKPSGKPAGKPLGILFVCAGNICRSPLAEGIFLHLAEAAGMRHRFLVDSAGTGGWHAGDPPDPRSIKVAQRRGIALPSRARQVRLSDFSEFAWILAMDGDNAADLRRVAPVHEHGRIHLMRGFDAQAPPLADVPDPYYGGESGFEEVFLMLDKACRGFLESLLNSPGFKP